MAAAKKAAAKKAGVEVVVNVSSWSSQPGDRITVAPDIAEALVRHGQAHYLEDATPPEPDDEGSGG